MAEVAVIVQLNKNCHVQGLGGPGSKHRVSRKEAESLQKDGFARMVDVISGDAPAEPADEAPDVLTAAPVNRQAPKGVQR